MNDIKYVTIFPECESVHLKKDVGMLPYSLGEYCGYDFSIVCYDNPFFKAEENNKFHIVTIPKKLGDVSDFAGYIIKKAKEIDILNLYHITSRRNLLWIILYKLFNPKGIVHLKLDADYRMVDMLNFNSKSLKSNLKMKILREKVDLYTVESQAMKTILEQEWQLNIKVIPNGIFREGEINPARVDEKENIFLTVGRLGTVQKATEDLLSAFEKIKNKTDWKLVLAGSIEKSFLGYIDDYYNRNPELRERVIFTGNIHDTTELTNLYKKAKIFVLPSKWEGFALVLLEALECGDYLIVSDQVPSVGDIGKNGQYADLVRFGDVNQLADSMLKATNRKLRNEEMSEMYKWIHENFTWKPIVKKLNQYIKEII